MSCIFNTRPPTLFKIFFLLQPFTMGMCYFTPKCSINNNCFWAFFQPEVLVKPLPDQLPTCLLVDLQTRSSSVSTGATNMTISSWRALTASWRKVPGKLLVTSYGHHNLRHPLHCLTCAAKGQRLLKAPELTMPCLKDCLSYRYKRTETKCQMVLILSFFSWQIFDFSANVTVLF